MLNNVRVILSHTTHPGNIGAAARAMKTMGLTRLYLINPRHFPDAQAKAMAEGADDVLENAVVCASLDEALQGVVFVAGMSARVRDISQEVLAPREAMPLVMQQARQPVALLFGTEMSGLTNEELARCQLMVRIPVNPDFTSLNIAASVQLVSYELRLAAGQGDCCGAPEVIPAPAEHVEGFFRQLEEALTEIGFLNSKHPTKLMHKLRRLYARARLEPEEINILRGILTLTTHYHGQLKRDVKINGEASNVQSD